MEEQVPPLVNNYRPLITHAWNYLSNIILKILELNSTIMSSNSDFLNGNLYIKNHEWKFKHMVLKNQKINLQLLWYRAYLEIN